MLVLLTISFLVMQASCEHDAPPTVTIYPKVKDTAPNTRVQIVCKTSDARPLAGCQFKELGVETVWDLSEGNASTSTAQYRYNGAGLERGECGVDMWTGPLNWYKVMGCRLRTEDGPWMYEDMLVNVYRNGTNTEPLPYRLNKNNVTVKRGTPMAVIGHSYVAMDSCSYKWHDRPRWMFYWNNETSRDGAEYYFFRSASGSACGLTLVGVDRRGFFLSAAGAAARVAAGGSARRYGRDYVSVALIEPPCNPILTADKVMYNVSDTLRATCTVSSTPVSQLSWYLDDKLVRNDTRDESEPETRWRWNYEIRTITQHFTILHVNDTHHGKRLKCLATHENHYYKATFTIFVENTAVGFMAKRSPKTTPYNYVWVILLITLNLLFGFCIFFYIRRPCSDGSYGVKEETDETDRERRETRISPGITNPFQTEDIP